MKSAAARDSEQRKSRKGFSAAEGDMAHLTAGEEDRHACRKFAFFARQLLHFAQSCGNIIRQYCFILNMRS